MSFKSNLVHLIHNNSLNNTNEMIHVIENQIGCFYLGVDPTGATIHLGHLIALKLACELIQHGWKCIILIGGFTGQIGDPTGKDKARVLISSQAVETYSDGILSDIKRVLQPYDITYVNNADWLNNMTIAQYMEYVSNISVNKKLTQDTYKNRIENSKPLSMKEFMYTDLQAIDFQYLHAKYNCNMQIGGSDQWGNISTGLSLLNNVYGITTPLLTIKGNKMGKTTQNAVSIYENPLKLIHFLVTLPSETKDQLSQMFCDGKNDFIYCILYMLYHSENVTQYIETYNSRQICKNINDALDAWFVTIHEAKLSNILYTLYGYTKEHAKTLIEQNACYVNHQIVNTNQRLENGKYIINVANNISEFVMIDIITKPN